MTAPTTDRTRPVPHQHVVVLGAGLSGLAAARRVQRDGERVTVVEVNAQPGGTLATATVDGFRFELGPNTVQQSPALDAVVADAGASDGWRTASPAARRRYLVRKGRLVALPSAPPGIFTTRALSPLARLRLLAEPFRGRGPGIDESMAAFIQRRLGRGAHALADAMVLGVYAGDPQELSVGRAFPRLFAFEREHGSLLRGLRRVEGPRPALVSYAGGFARLAERLADGLDVRTRTRVTHVHRIDDGNEGGFRVDFQGPGGDTTLHADRVVVALPARATADVLSPLDRSSGAGASALAAIAALPHAPVAVVGLGFDRGQITHPLDGFGLLSPHREGKRILGALFSSTLFPDCAPDGGAVLTAMVGGRRRPGLVDLDNATLVHVATDALRDLLGLRGAPRVTRVARWQPGIPQPTPASQAAWDAATTLEKRHPGLEILGNWRHGVGVPDCAAAGWQPSSA